ncbi:hypothetical protein Y900_030960 [Mycolicibacterium aromaticivorans JS19b1 = JCM 16368]|uniref:Uncharacterized protein n=1 Tax=Mycolicibacterium aromaticivorans JS19b1 = JCM 16368 TaxID=1440774 RepID=A0A064C7T9_9MYCO|nr:hypothetical protein [Mycolicibacterium aromaticivorans]KDE96714.1 hypothetical protein Y900_030765 [Mycolicibacterium aromaticivorans JS19b1 = JCM 16368]KDE96746.1 hypothetical protein Y900_030960 [Mycolicibacterium aromaticivorans JS19b1 = JCM 16368]
MKTPESFQLVSEFGGHRHTGRLARFYMVRPQHPEGLDPLDYSSDPDDLPGYAAWKQQWDQENAAERYETDKPLWDLVSGLPEIADVFIGTTKDSAQQQRAEHMTTNTSISRTSQI